MTQKNDDTRPLAERFKALAWLFKLYATVKALFNKLPELEAAGIKPVDPTESKDGVREYAVVVWAPEADLLKFRIKEMWEARKIASVRTSLTEWVRRLREITDGDSEPRIQIAQVKRTTNKDEVDWLIADAATRYKVGPYAFTLAMPEGGLRINRRARRAALSRVKRALRRESRRAVGRRRVEALRARTEADRVRRAELSA